MPHSELGQAIQKLRKALGGISQEQFARRLGVTMRTIARWEASENLSPQILSRLHNVAAINFPGFDLTNYFEERLRKSFEFERAGETAETPEEKLLIAEFLRRYRNQDAAIQPWVDQLWDWMAIGKAQLEREIKAHHA